MTRKTKTAIAAVVTVLVAGGVAAGVIGAGSHSATTAGTAIAVRTPSAKSSSTTKPSARKPAAGRTSAGEPPTKGTPAGPSGQPIPTGDLPGWRLVASDDFAGTSVDTRQWQEYGGTPRDDPGGLFDPRHLRVAGGELVESTYRDPRDHDAWASAGLKSTLSQRYGMYEVRLRFAAGAGVAHNVLLYPASNRFPPEVDFSEDNGASPRTVNDGVLRYGATATRRAQVAVDLSTWHTFGVEWTPGELRYTLDGRVWATQKGAMVPSIPMELAIQTQTWACHTAGEVCPTAATPHQVDLDVDWVVQYAYAPGT